MIKKIIFHKFQLYQNYPNPFNPTTKIKYTIPAPPNLPNGEALVQLKVYDILGKEIFTLVNKQQQPGNYEVDFNAAETYRNASLPSGVYFYQIKVSDANSNLFFVQTRKMILLK